MGVFRKESDHLEQLLLGKTAFITGCNRGIGSAILEEYAKHGANIFAHARTESEDFLSHIRELKEKYQVEIQPVFFDLTDETAMKTEIKALVKSKTKIDILVNNAGVIYNALFQMSTSDSLRQQFEVNFFAPFLLTQYISKIMVKHKSGSIINLSSIAALDANVGKSVYGASKAAVICMSDVIANELGSSGVRSNCIAPGATKTEMLGTMSEEVIQETIEKTALKRVGMPTDIAGVAVFLGSDLSGYVTGQVIRADGGIS